jgi:hypothetical protein
MRFFIPAANNVSHGEMQYREICQHLTETVGPVSDKRIYRLRFRDGERVINLAVGDSFRRFNGEPVLAIVETSDSYFVCTLHHGASHNEGFRVPRDTVMDFEEFTALA